MAKSKSAQFKAGQKGAEKTMKKFGRTLDWLGGKDKEIKKADTEKANKRKESLRQLWNYIEQEKQKSYQQGQEDLKNKDIKSNFKVNIDLRKLKGSRKAK